jgi:cytochrome c-type biogenesis protein CcmH
VRAAAWCVLVAAVTLGAAAPRALDERVREIAGNLRCPVCQNLSVGDSPSGLAIQMRGVIKDKLEAGESREQIEAYFVERYGEWVLLAPKKQGFNLVAWLLPFIGVVVGAVGVAVVSRRWAARQAAAAPAGPPPPASPEERAYRERLRKELEEFAR